jgi:RecG-like helicase
MPEFRVADLLSDVDLLTRAREDARSIVEQDPHLQLPGHILIAHHLRAQFQDALATIHVG